MIVLLILLLWCIPGIVGGVMLMRNDIRVFDLKYNRKETIGVCILGFIAGWILFIPSLGLALHEYIPESISDWMNEEVRLGVPKKEETRF